MQIKNDSANSFVHSFLGLATLAIQSLDKLANIAMQAIETTNYESSGRRGGTRVASAEYLRSLKNCEDFSGLEEDTNRYGLLLLVKKVGKSAGFTPRIIQLLDHYMAFTREIDWEQGSRPIVYQSIARTALDLGVTERQIQHLEKRLFDLGAITWHDSGNHRRYGQRDQKTGKILYAYGVDLTPLAFLKAKLEDVLHEKQLYDNAWLETKRQISWYRRQIRAVLLETDMEEGARVKFELRYEEITIKIRTHIDLEQLRALLARHKCLHSDLMKKLGGGEGETTEPAQQAKMAQRTPIVSPRDARNFVPIESTTQKPSDKSESKSGWQGSVEKPSERQTGFRGNEQFGKLGVTKHVTKQELILATGLQHISLGAVLQTTTERFREYLPLESRALSWTDVVDAAYRLRKNLHISQQDWGEACQLLNQTGAAVCVVLTDRAMQRPENPVRKPAGYFRSMLKRARGGELRLHRSMLGSDVSH